MLVIICNAKAVLPDHTNDLILSLEPIQRRHEAGITDIGVANIFAIGDMTHGAMLAHKASHQGHIAAEMIAGHKVTFQPLTILPIAYTFPEVA